MRVRRLISQNRMTRRSRSGSIYSYTAVLQASSGKWRTQCNGMRFLCCGHYRHQLPTPFFFLFLPGSLSASHTAPLVYLVGYLILQDVIMGGGHSHRRCISMMPRAAFGRSLRIFSSYFRLLALRNVRVAAPATACSPTLDLRPI